ncbi:hypothetical protein, partial [Streptomyces eurythermus]|uniref:hypothetical protein n=1 Tax=Streptomyces eurythermus TaxID=42237 RepID=UPI0033C8C9A9
MELCLDEVADCAVETPSSPEDRSPNETATAMSAATTATIRPADIRRYPVPLSWGATFDPDLIRRMAAAIG